MSFNSPACPGRTGSGFVVYKLSGPACFDNITTNHHSQTMIRGMTIFNLFFSQFATAMHLPAFQPNLISAARFTVLAFALAATLSSSALHAQSFEILGGVDPDTGESWVFNSGVFASYSGDVIYGRRTGGQYGLLINGTFQPLTLPHGARVTNMSGDGRVLVGRACATVQVCYDVPFAYYIDEERFEFLTFPSVIGSMSIGFGRGNHRLYISYDGSIIAGSFTVRYTGEDALVYSYRWVNGVRQDISEGNRFWAISGISDDGSIIAGQTLGNNSPAFHDGALKLLPMPSYAHSSTYSVQISPDGKTFAYTILRFNATPYTSPHLFNDGQLIEIGLTAGYYASGHGEALFVANEGRFLIGEEGTRNDGRPATLWTPELGIGWLTDVFVNHYGFDLSPFRPENLRRNFRPVYHTPPGVIYGVGTLNNRTNVAWRAVLVPKEDDLIVNSAADRPNVGARATCDTGESVGVGSESVPECTLRAAMEVAAERGVRDSISVNIPEGGPYIINLTSPLPVPTSPIVIDATTQPGFNVLPLISLNGTNNIENGFVLEHGESAVRGFSIGGFTNAGILLNGGSKNVIEANHIGIDARGTAPFPNHTGIIVENSSENRIGGPEPGQRNIISGNSGAGIHITGEEAAGNVIAGNRIGTNAPGSTALANGSSGIVIAGSPGNIIGGDNPPMRNIISGNTGAGVFIEGAASDGNSIQGNYIGTDNNGVTAIANAAEGILIEAAPNTRIGTDASGSGNMISGNGAGGILINGHLTEGHADGTLVLNNIIGLDATGEVPLFNGGEAVIRLNGAVRQAKIGQAGAGNVIAGNNKMHGAELLDLGEEAGAPDGTQVAGNYIGVTKSGASPEDNLLIGVVLSTESDQSGGMPGVVGGENAAWGNTIRATVGIVIEGDRSSNSVVAYNVVGKVDEAISAEDRNAIGIWINGANQVQILSNTIGGQTAGILLGSNESTVILNKIGTNTAGSAARPNTIGLWIPGEIGDGFSTGDGNMIGNEEGGNVISGNKTGLLIGGSFNPFPTGTGAAGTEAIIAAGYRQVFTNSAKIRSWKSLSELPPDTPSLKKRASGISTLQNDENGEPDNNVIMLNRIGTNPAGDKEIGNGRAGTEEEASAAIRIESGTNNRLIGNLISGNGGGVYIGPDDDFTTEPANTILAGNLIGGSLASATASIPNQYGGVIIFNSAGNRLTALPISEGGDPVGNTIRGNGKAGVMIGILDTEDVGNQVRQSSFFDNKGPSIMLLNAEEEYPDMAPQIPQILAAAALPDDASLAFVSYTVGTVDGFLSKACEDGHGQGEYMFSLEVEPGTNVVGLPYHQLKSNSEDALSLYLALTITSAVEAGMTSEFSECYRIARESDIDSTAFSINDKGELINGVGIKVEVNANSGEQSVQSGMQSISNLEGEGMLYVTRYRVRPVVSPIDGTAESSDGSIVTPDMASTDRYWSLRSTGISNISYGVCLDIEELPGADNPEQLLVLHRRSTSLPWQPYDSTIEDGQLCAEGLTHFGDIGIGGHSEGNYLPLDPGVQNIPGKFALNANYPNPFNPSTIISYSLPETIHVKLEVYDMAGRKIATLLDQSMPAGQHEVVFNAGNLASGMYFTRMEAGLFSSFQKMLLIK
ncbi:MAG: T9SS C-terminal target domain-containing protein [Balneolaceae bacterium]|nr:MAG: T9SS C-terminal target domain-containing protein [Balneolaceae bacterium]